ncbi:hypothetical protein ACFFX0_32540 [Citricoccus parietis]|uniref:Uncharacterized protein n=1 Tax=Citricoccus parietis TaxID=592307 RepID=A0ABV5G9K7_9MICC
MKGPGWGRRSPGPRPAHGPHGRARARVVARRRGAHRKVTGRGSRRRRRRARGPWSYARLTGRQAPHRWRVWRRSPGTGSGTSRHGCE